jgi:hypothetical protein
MEHNERCKDTDHITLPFIPDEALIKKTVAEKLK